jgi:hypothetical protein
MSVAALGSKLNDTPIGVVNESKDMIDDFGFAASVGLGGGTPKLNVDQSHFIGAAFATNPIAPYAALDWYQIVNEPIAAGVDPVGTWVDAPWTDKPALMTLSAGAQLIGGGVAAGRRVQLPMGSGQGATPFRIESLSEDGRLLIRRAVEWAAGMEVVCGDGSCGVGEECDCPADCGAPAVFEQPGVTCADGLDNDCDGFTDCDDINCPSDPACAPAVCGDGTCAAGEDSCDCPEDCGAPPAWEDPGTMCDDGLDNDCDGQIDCADANCTTHPNCCRPAGEYCVMNSECCSGTCNAGKNQCK